MTTPKTLPYSRGLTPGYGEIAERQHAKTYAGMAFFAATGPFGKTCGDCVFYGAAYQRIRNASGEIVKTRRKPRSCGKHQDLGGKGGDIPAHTEACRYYEEGSR